MRVKHPPALSGYPENIKKLRELAYNLWYSWNHDAKDLFIQLSPDLWEECDQNPARMLSCLSEERLRNAVEDITFCKQLDRTHEQFKEYLNRNKWFQVNHGKYKKSVIAYFSLEYGLDAGLPIYAGGLGLLAGDSLKAASDLGIPVVALGLLYRYGYFRQFCSADGWQQERYDKNDWDRMPITPVRDHSGKPLRITVRLEEDEVQVQVWKAAVGNISLYLMDTDIPENKNERERGITGNLYGGDKDMRIRQEIILGIGGIRVLEALAIEPKVFHLNEGHSWFLTLERIRQLTAEHSLSFAEATYKVRSSTVFTTHTPVPAGNEKFEPDIIRQFSGKIVEQLGIDWKDFLSLGRINPEDELEHFGLTEAALRTSAFRNGVSRLHGKVSRELWKDIWPDLPTDEVPIGSITNGVHPGTWLSHEMSELYRSSPEFQHDRQPESPEVWAKVVEIPDARLWNVHNRCRHRLVQYARGRLARQLAERGESSEAILQTEERLDPDILTIGFARRFSSYKRGDLLFYDPDRLAAIVNDPIRPVQIILAGKAHPLDNQGKGIIQHIIAASQEARFRQHILFLEDYDIGMATYLVQGVDVWLNNPRRPQEASGTSGMKACLNGCLHLSVLDGWWAEGYSEEVGFKIGAGEEYDNPDDQDKYEAEALFSVLEKKVIPLFYDRNSDGLPEGWIARMKASIRIAGQKFTSHRMMIDYTNQCYIPALEAAEKESSPHSSTG